MSSCEDDAKGYIAGKVTLGFDSNVLGEATKVQGDAHSGQFFSRVTAANPYGIGYVIHVPDSVPGDIVKVIVQGWVRSSAGQSKGTFVTSTSRRDSMLSWNYMMVRKFMYEPNTWNFFKDSMFVTRTINGLRFDKIAVFANLDPGVQETFDVDDLTVTFKAE